MDTKDTLDILRKRLQDAGFTDYDLSDDSVLMDITAKVFAILSAPLEAQMDIIEMGQSITNYDKMTADQMDSLIANVFLKRREGAYAKTIVSVYFTAEVDMTISATDVYFYTKSGLKFYPQSDYSFYKHQMMPETLLGTTYYRYDVPCIAEKRGSAYEVGENTILYSSMAVPYLSHVNNKNAATGGVTEEDNTALKTSAERAIATRDNVMKDSIWTVFMQKYGDLLDIHTVGYLDEEMQRDVARVSWCFYGHRGGMADVYVKTSPRNVTEKCIAVPPDTDESSVEFTDIDEEVFCNTVYFDQDAYDDAEANGELYIIRSRGDVRVDYDWVPYATAFTQGSINNYIPCPVVYGLTFKYEHGDIPILAVRSHNKHHTYSTREAVDYYVQLSEYMNETITAEYFRNESIENYQKDIVDPTSRPIVADILFKNFIPIVIDKLKITYVNTGTGTVVKKDVEDTIKNYLFNYTGTYPIYISEIIQLVVNKTGIVLPEIGVRDTSPDITPDTIADTPFYIEYTQHNIDGSKITTKSTRVLAAVENDLLSSSCRTCRYYLADNFLTLEEA